MPIVSTETKSKSGYNVLRSVYEDPVTVPDAQHFIDSVKPGAPFEHHGHLVLGKVTALDGEVKKVLGSQQADPGNPPPVAMVISSAIIRMVASLAMRAGANENMEFFRDEASALEWLDGRLAVYESKRPKAPGKKAT